MEVSDWLSPPSRATYSLSEAELAAVAARIPPMDELNDEMQKLVEPPGEKNGDEPPCGASTAAPGSNASNKLLPVGVLQGGSKIRTRALSTKNNF